MHNLVSDDEHLACSLRDYLSRKDCRQLPQYVKLEITICHQKCYAKIASDSLLVYKSVITICSKCVLFSRILLSLLKPFGLSLTSSHWIRDHLTLTFLDD